MEICCDAISYNKEEEKFVFVLSRLTPDDIKKFYFLCLDDFDSPKICPQTIEDFFLLFNSRNNNEKYDLLKELLFYIKKYKLLITLNTCRHQMETNLKKGPRFVDCGRLILYNLCEDLKNSDIETLKSMLNVKNIPSNPEWKNVAGEEFFSFWLREITKEKMLELENALSTFKYEKLKEFKNQCRDYFDKPFSIKSPLTGKPCGLAVIFIFENFNLSAETSEDKMYSRANNLTKRTGIKSDEEKLIKLWHNHGFDILVFKDLRSTDMMHVIGKLHSFHYNDYDIFLSCILTHGSRGKIYASDNIPLGIYEDIIYKICTEALQDKPKLFFIQACQDKANQNERLFDNKTDEISCLTRYLMVAMSTTPLNLSFRADNEGSWFISDLTSVLSIHDTTTTDMWTLMNRVNDQVTKRSGPYEGKIVTQTPELRTTVMRQLYLKKLERSPLIQKLDYNNLSNCHILYPVIGNLPSQIKLDVYLV